jgi:hypothetical protein
VSIRGIHLAQNLRYSNVATIASNALQPIFSSLHSFLVVIRRFARMSWSRRSSFRGVTAVHGRPERGLSFTSLSPLLKRATHRLPHCANIHWLVSVNVQQASVNIIRCKFFRMEEFIYTPLFHMPFHVRRHFVRLPLGCRTATKFNGILTGRFNLYCHIINIRLWRRGPT